MRALVLGVNGYLGSALFEQLRTEGIDVTGISRTVEKTMTSTRAVDRNLLEKSETEVAEYLDPFDIVFYLLGSTGPRTHFDAFFEEFNHFSDPFFRFIAAAEIASTKKIVYPSSGGTIYTSSEQSSTETSRIDPQSPYAITKVLAEHVIEHYVAKGSFAADIYRVANPYGKYGTGDTGKGVISHLVNSHLDSKPFRLIENPAVSKDYIHIRDTATLLIHSIADLSSSEKWNIGTGIRTSLEQLIALVGELSGRPVEVERAYDTAAVPSDSFCLDPTKILRRFPKHQLIDLRSGVAEMLDSIALQD